MSLIKKVLVVGLIVSSTATSGVTSTLAHGPAGGTTTALSAAGQKLAVGSAHACAIVEAKVYCWGDNAEGQLGTLSSEVTGSNVPILVAGIGDALAVTAGYAHTCALLVDKTVSCWGSNQSKNLGRTTGTNGEPGVVAGLSDVRAISAGNATTCVIVGSVGKVQCWGANTGSSGSMLGRPTGGSPASFDPDPTPGDVTGLTSGVTALSVGQGSACALMVDKTLKCWGSNWEGRLGNGTNTPTTDTSGPVSVTGLTDVAAVAVGAAHACAVVSSGKVYCWGQWESGQLGIDLGINDITEIQNRGGGRTPMETLDARASTNYLLNAQAITAGSSFSCAVRVTGAISCWGRNSDGELGTGGKSQYVLAPVSVSGMTDAAVVAAGSSFACSMATSGIVKCWGAGGFASNSGQIGNGSNSEALTPATVVGVVPQSITFGTLADKSASDPAFTLSASASSGGAVSFASTTPSVCTVSGSTVTLVSVGTCTIAATRGSLGLYKAADTVSRSFSVTGQKPSATTGSASAETTTATLGAEVNPNGADTNVTFQYGTSATLATSESVAVSAAVTGATAKAVSASVSKLSPGTTYFWRVVATNAIGSATGDIKSFTTKGSKPTVSTVSASRGTSGMTLNGKVNANNLDTTVRFEYGTSATLVGAQQTAAKTQTGATEEDVSAAISGLAENTTYYYRIVASNELGTATGETKSFTTVGPEGVSINDGDEFTSSAKVVISVVGPPNAARIQVANDGGFKNATTFDLIDGSADVPWTLVVSRDGTFTKTVYVRFLSRFNAKVTDDKTDDIILDTSKPKLETVAATPVAAPSSAVMVSAARAKPKAASGVRLSVRAIDTISGAVAIEVRSAANKPAIRVTLGKAPSKVKTVGLPRRTSATVTLRSSAKALQIRAVDGAGNMSGWIRVAVKK